MPAEQRIPPTQKTHCNTDQPSSENPIRVQQCQQKQAGSSMNGRDTCSVCWFILTKTLQIEKNIYIFSTRAHKHTAIAILAVDRAVIKPADNDRNTVWHPLFMHPNQLFTRAELKLPEKKRTIYSKQNFTKKDKRLDQKQHSLIKPQAEGTRKRPPRINNKKLKELWKFCSNKYGRRR